MKTNIIMMYVMRREKLELLRETIANHGKFQVEDGYKQVVVEILLKGL
jgi:hypothetical protein